MSHRGIFNKTHLLSDLFQEAWYHRTRLMGQQRGEGGETSACIMHAEGSVLGEGQGEDIEDGREGKDDDQYEQAAPDPSGVAFLLN